MVCKFCGNTIEDSSEFCFICGNKIIKDEAPAEAVFTQPVPAEVPVVTAEAPAVEPQAVYAPQGAPVYTQQAPIYAQQVYVQQIAEPKKAKKAKKQKAVKPMRENRVLEFSMAGLFIGIVASFLLADKVALVLSGCFFAGIVLGMIFKRKTYVESLDELEIEEEYEEAVSLDYTAYESEEPEAEIITAE